MKKASLFVFIILSAYACSTATVKPQNTAGQSVEKLYESFFTAAGPNLAQLNLFFTKMPKGGDLHHHYSGSLYVETYLDWVENAGYFINKNTLKIDETHTLNSITVAELRANTALYRELLTLWSDKDYHNHFHDQAPPDLNFFNTFGYFGTISKYAYKEGLSILKHRAKQENITYIESMISTVPYDFKDDEQLDRALLQAGNREEIFAILDRFKAKLDSDSRLSQSVSAFVSDLQEFHRDIDDAQFLMRYQTYASRNGTPSEVFASLYSAYLAADASDLIVGVNIVGPENGFVAIRDYRLHMYMFDYLRNKYPGVNRALHAGELTLGMVRPKNLTFHITQAIDIAGAQRIGHGIDLPYESDSLGLLEKIKRSAVIEINLTSNEFILGVKGEAHPYLIYSSVDAPLIISTDDSGVSRNNLTNEYVLLASRYHPSYETIKKYVYNSIKYSFMTEEEKSHWSADLDARFAAFEDEMRTYSPMK